MGSFVETFAMIKFDASRNAWFRHCTVTVSATSYNIKTNLAVYFTKHRESFRERAVLLVKGNLLKSPDFAVDSANYYFIKFKEPNSPTVKAILEKKTKTKKSELEASKPTPKAAPTPKPDEVVIESYALRLMHEGWVITVSVGTYNMYKIDTHAKKQLAKNVFIALSNKHLIESAIISGISCFTLAKPKPAPAPIPAKPAPHVPVINETSVATQMLKDGASIRGNVAKGYLINLKGVSHPLLPSVFDALVRDSLLKSTVLAGGSAWVYNKPVEPPKSNTEKLQPILHDFNLSLIDIEDVKGPKLKIILKVLDRGAFERVEFDAAIKKCFKKIESTKIVKDLITIIASN